MHGYIQMIELYLYVSNGYFTAFCNTVHNLLVDKFHFDFSSAYSIDLQNSYKTNPDGPHVIHYGNGDLDGKGPHHQ